MLDVQYIIQENELNCSEQEFKDYYNSIDKSKLENDLQKTEVTIRTFGQLYNWKEISNPANWKYYYLANIDWRNFVQNIVPYIGWNQPLDDSNINDVISEHKNTLINDYITQIKIEESINYFKNL